MQIPTYRFNHDLHLYNIADIHYGDDCCDRELFKKHVQMIYDDPIGRWCSVGDILNVASTPGSKSNPSKSMALQKEQDEMEVILKPIANKCLGFVSSNHHHRLVQTTGSELDKNLSKIIGIPWLGALGVFNITLGRCSYFIAMHHGVGGGKKKGGKTNSLDDLGKLIPGADVYLEGHSHFYITYDGKTPYIDKKRLTRDYYPANFTATAGYLKYEDSYAEDKKLEPLPLGCARLTLYANDSGKTICKKVESTRIE